MCLRCVNSVNCHVVFQIKIRIDYPPDFTGPLAENDLLSSATKLFEGQFLGPESLAVFRGEIYTGISDGRIIRIKGDKFETVANIGLNGCSAEGMWDQRRCGRPLGLRFDSRGTLYAVDAYFGLKKIDIKTGRVEEVFNNQKVPIAGRFSKFFDDFVIHENSGTGGKHVFYVSDASSKWDSDFHVGITAEHESTGRLIKIDEGDLTHPKVMVDSIGFTNGVELTDDKNGLIYSELNKRRLMIYHINGTKKGTNEVLVPNLPGEPDNIRRSASRKAETYWVALFSGRNKTHPHFFLDRLMDKPLTRKAIAQVVHNLGAGLFWAGSTLNYYPLKDLGFKLKSGFLFATCIASRGLILEINRSGQILRSFHSPQKSVTALSEVREVIEDGRNVLYLGSYYNYYLGKVVLPK